MSCRAARVPLRREVNMGRKKLSTTVYITPEQNERLKALHERTKVPVAEYIREDIDLVLERYRHHFPGQLTFDDLKLPLAVAESPRRREQPATPTSPAADQTT